MSVVALLGDCTTTTAVALAAVWPDAEPADPLVIVESDRSGGSLAAWLDTPSTPSLSTIVASWREHTDLAWAPIDAMLQHAASGVSFVAAPVRAREANRAIDEAELTVFPRLVAQPGLTILADLGRPNPSGGIPALAASADVVVVCHRQTRASAAAAAVRLERLAELVELVATTRAEIVVALIGDEPFDPAEIEQFLADAGTPSHSLRSVPFDELSAAVLAGRVGVSARRWQRLPLARAARSLARDLHQLLAGADHRASTGTAR